MTKRKKLIKIFSLGLLISLIALGTIYLSKSQSSTSVQQKLEELEKDGGRSPESYNINRK